MQGPPLASLLVASGQVVFDQIAPVSGKMAGNDIDITAAGTRYTGTLSGSAITGKANSGGKEESWTAKK